MNINSKRRIALSAFFFITGLCFASWASRIPDIQLKIGLSEGELGGLLLSKPVGSLLAMPLAGRLVDRFGSRSVMIIGAFMYPAILVVIGFAPSFWTLATALVLLGMCGNMLNISMNTQALGVEALYGKTIIASFHGVWSLAGFSGAMIGALMISLKLMPAVHFLIVAGFSCLVVVVVYRFTIRQDVKNPGKGFVLRKPDPLLLRIGLIALCGMMCEGCMFDWSGVYFQKVVQAEKGMIAAGYIAFMCTMALGRFVSDFFTDRLGTTRMLQVSSLLITSGLLLAITLPGLITAIAGFLLVGFGTSSVIPLSFSAAGKSGSLSPGIALAMVASIGYFGFLAGPPLIGFIAETTNLRVSFTFIACVGAMIGVLAMSLSPVKPRPQFNLRM